MKQGMNKKRNNRVNIHVWKCHVIRYPLKPNQSIKAGLSGELSTDHTGGGQAEGKGKRKRTQVHRDRQTDRDKTDRDGEKRHTETERVLEQATDV